MSFFKGLGLSGLEPPTSRLSGVRSNQLSYKPILKFGCSLPVVSERVKIKSFIFDKLIIFNSGSHLLSRTVSSKVPSAA